MQQHCFVEAVYNSQHDEQSCGSCRALGKLRESGYAVGMHYAQVLKMHIRATLTSTLPDAVMVAYLCALLKSSFFFRSSKEAVMWIGYASVAYGSFSSRLDVRA